VRHLLIILSFLLLTSPLFGDNHKGETLYRWGKYSDNVWKGFGDKDTHPVYKGDVKNGKPNGLGSLTYPDGSKYVGEFKDGKQNGQGTYTFGKGKWEGGKYVGEFKDGKYNGQGTFTKKNGKKYVGEWKDGRKDGQGTDIFPDGSKGIGEFREGRPWNITHRDKNGNIIVKFVNGKQIKP